MWIGGLAVADIHLGLHRAGGGPSGHLPGHHLLSLFHAGRNSERESTAKDQLCHRQVNCFHEKPFCLKQPHETELLKEMRY